MSFVNEFISKEDWVKYGIDEIDARFVVGGTKSPHWAIDRGQDSYLRQVANGREEFSNEQTYTFLWRGHMLFVKLRLLANSGNREGEGWVHYELMHLGSPGQQGLAPEIEPMRAEILSDLKAALTAYKAGGVYSTWTSATVILDV